MQNKHVARTSVSSHALQGKRVDNPTRPVRLFRSWSKERSTTDGTIAAGAKKNEYEHLDTRQLYAGKKALIVGAGPAGSVTAAFLAKQGFLVDVYEKREDPAQVYVKGKRAVMITLQRASVDVLRAAGIRLPEYEHDFFNGIHHYSGLAYMKRDGQIVCQNAGKGRFMVERQDLAKHIIATAREGNPETTKFHFNHDCINADLAKQKVKFQCPDNKIMEQDYDLLIGADGVDSEVRKAMERDIKHFNIYTKPNTLFYKSYRDIIVHEDTVHGNYTKILQQGWVTFCQTSKLFGGKEGLQTISFTRLMNGTLIGNFYGTGSGFENIKGKEQEYLHEVLPEGFPRDWMDQMVPLLTDNSLYRLPSITEVSTMTGPRVVLLGDAAHSVGPRLGQGCNMALQDGQALYNALKVQEGDLDGALKRFNEDRLEQVRHDQLLAKVASADTSEHKGISKLLPILVKIHDAFHVYGNKYMPWLIPRAPVDRFRTGEISTRKAAEILKWELNALTVVIAAVLILLVKVLFFGKSSFN